MPEKDVKTLPPELIREVLLVSDQRTVLTLRCSSKLCKFFADEVILLHLARNPHNIKLVLSTRVDPQNPPSAPDEPQNPPIDPFPNPESVAYVGSDARLHLQKRTVVLDLVFANPSDAFDPSIVDLPEDTPNSVSKLRESVKYLQHKYAVLALDIIETIRFMQQILSFRFLDGRGRKDINKKGQKMTATMREIILRLGKFNDIGTEYQDMYNEFLPLCGPLRELKVMVNPFSVPSNRSYACSLTAKGRILAQVCTNPACAGGNIKGPLSLIYWSVLFHPPEYGTCGDDDEEEDCDDDEEEDCDDDEEGGDDDEEDGDDDQEDGDGVEIGILMAGMRNGDQVDVMGMRMELDVRSALLLGGFDRNTDKAKVATLSPTKRFFSAFWRMIGS
ncbi:hypothetical protein HK104_009894 [Borealophlyctis nickersoniae]|nr:hypothetical protein HK104_009894 [Borealophlyctis nickersoniae]